MCHVRMTPQEEYDSPVDAPDRVRQDAPSRFAVDAVFNQFAGARVALRFGNVLVGAADFNEDFDTK